MWLDNIAHRLKKISDNDFVGDIRDVLNDIFVVVENTKQLDKYGSIFYVNELRDSNNDHYVVFTSDNSFEINATYHIESCIVSLHSSYKKMNQTKITSLKGIEKIDSSYESLVSYIKDIRSEPNLSSQQRKEMVVRRFPSYSEDIIMETAKKVAQEPKEIEQETKEVGQAPVDSGEIDDASGQEPIAPTEDFHEDVLGEPSSETPDKDIIAPQSTPSKITDEDSNLLERTDSGPMTFLVAEMYMPYVEERVAYYNKRKIKLGLDQLPDIKINIISTKDMPMRRKEPSEIKDLATAIMERFFEIEIIGEIPSFKGWEFVGTIDNASDSGDNNLIITKIPGKDIPDEIYKNILKRNTMVCEHCNTIRRRNRTYIIHHADPDEYKEVASSCIKDFFGGGPASGIASWAEMLSQLDQDLSSMEDDMGDDEKGSRIYYISLHEFMATVMASIRENGWVSSKDKSQLSTAQNALTDLFAPRSSKQLELTVDDYQKAKQIIEWAAETLSNKDYDEILNGIAGGKSDTAQYLYALGTIAQGGVAGSVNIKNVGLGASMYIAWRNNKPIENREEARSRGVFELSELAEHYPEGTKGPFILKFLGADLDRPYYRESNMYSTENIVIYRHDFLDENDIPICWYTQLLYEPDAVLAVEILKEVAPELEMSSDPNELAILPQWLDIEWNDDIIGKIESALNIYIDLDADDRSFKEEIIKKLYRFATVYNPMIPGEWYVVGGTVSGYGSVRGDTARSVKIKGGRASSIKPVMTENDTVIRNNKGKPLDLDGKPINTKSIERPQVVVPGIEQLDPNMQVKFRKVYNILMRGGETMWQGVDVVDTIRQLHRMGYIWSDGMLTFVGPEVSNEKMKQYSSINKELSDIFNHQDSMYRERNSLSAFLRENDVYLNRMDPGTEKYNTIRKAIEETQDKISDIDKQMGIADGKLFQLRQDRKILQKELMFSFSDEETT